MKRIFWFSLFVSIIILINPLCYSQTIIDLEPPSDPDDCKAALVMEADSGDIIYALNIREQLAPASMTKMMLVLITMEKIKAGEISMNDIITTSAHASKMGGSQVYLAHNEEFTLQEMLKAVLVQSANDASMAIAEHIAGSSTGFVDLMNNRAQQLGLEDTVYQSPHGLPPSKTQTPDLTSAKDLAILAREIVTRHPEVLKWSSLDKEPFRDGKFIMTNTNRLVRQFPGCDGLKTGYYRSAGFCVTATAMQNDVRVIVVVMGCKKGKHRFTEAARLMKWGLMKYKKINLIMPNTPVENSIPVVNGVKTETVPVSSDQLEKIVLKNRINDIIMKTTMSKNLTAPVEAGTICGDITFLLDDKEIGKTSIKTIETIEALNWWGKLKRSVGL